MKQIKIINAYLATEELAKQSDLPIQIKWTLFNLRKTLSTYYTFYVDESQQLFSKYETIKEGTSIIFETPDLAEEYKTKQDAIDNFEIELDFEKQPCKLSDIPNITVQQMETLENFIDFKPE